VNRPRAIVGVSVLTGRPSPFHVANPPSKPEVVLDVAEVVERHEHARDDRGNRLSVDDYERFVRYTERLEQRIEARHAGQLGVEVRIARRDIVEPQEARPWNVTRRVVAPDARQMHHDHVRVLQMLGQPLGRYDGRVELGGLGSHGGWQRKRRSGERGGHAGDPASVQVYHDSSRGLRE
jgi:hypothetical protein